MSGRRIVIEFLGKDKSLGSTATGVESKTSRLGATLKKVGLIAGGALAAGVLVAGKAMFDLAKAAAEDEKSQKALARTLKNVTGATEAQVAAVEDWISKQGVALGVADDELRPALQRLAEGSKSVSEAQRLASIAMDVSAGTGRSLKSVTEALLRAQNGSTAGLSRYGIATKDAEGKTLSFDEVVKGMSETFKGQASTAANTFEGKMGRLKLVFGETKEAIGAKLLPILSDLGTWFLRKGLPAVQKFGNWLSTNLGPVLSRIGEFIRTRVVPAAQVFYSWFVDKIVPGLKRFVAPILEGIRSLFEKIGAKLAENRPQLEKLGNAFRVLGEFLAKHVLPILGTLAGEALKRVGDVLGFTIDYVSSLIDAIGWLVDKIQDLIGWLGKIKVPDINLPNPFGRATPTAAGSGSLTQPTFTSVTGRALEHRAREAARASLVAAARGGGAATIVQVHFNGVVGDPRKAALMIKQVLAAGERAGV